MRIRKTTRHGNVRWEVDAGQKDGKRSRYFLKTEKAARAKVKELEKDASEVGRAWADLPAAKRSEVVEILGEISDRGLTLRTVWEKYKLHEAAQPGSEEKPLGEAIAECVAEKRATNRRETYLKQFANILDMFQRGREAEPVHSITPDSVRSFALAGESPNSKATRQSRLSTFFSWAVKRGYCLTSPVDRVEKIIAEYGPAKILTAEQCRALMAKAQEIDPGAVGELTLMLFAGIRSIEVERLKPDAIDLKRGIVTISGEIAKMRQRRVVELEPTAKAWLRKCRKGAILIDKNRYKRLRAIREQAGLTDWDQNCLRHTAASHIFAKHGGAKASRLLGHSEDMLHKHYRELVAPAETKKFWAIRPK